MEQVHGRSAIFQIDGQHAAKKAFVKRIAEITMRSETTVRCWIAGVQIQIRWHKNVIAQELGIPANELFPKEKVCAQ